MKKAIIYGRVSTSKQDNERQIQDLSRYAAANDFEVVKVYTDSVSGASKAAHRKAMGSLFTYIENEKVDIVLVHEISRLGRSAIDVQNTINKLVFEMKINVFIYNNKMAAFNEDGTQNVYFKFFTDITANFSEMEKNSIGQRTKSALVNVKRKYDASNERKGLKKGDKDYKQLGRPTGSTLEDAALLKKYKKVEKELDNGTSVRNTAKICEVSPFTVSKVKKAMARTKEMAA
jgi:DNA invertase Pin-like site-specific DNA recombinase